MVTIFPVLRQRIRENGVTIKELSAVLGTKKFVLQLKLLGIKRWTLTDAVVICGFFNYPNPEHLFLRNYNNQQLLESQGENYHV